VIEQQGGRPPQTRKVSMQHGVRFTGMNVEGVTVTVCEIVQ